MKLDIKEVIRDIEISLISIPDTDYIEEKLLKIYKYEDEIKQSENKLELAQLYYAKAMHKSSSYSLDESINYFEKSLELAKNADDGLWIAKCYSQLSSLLYKRGAYKESRQYFIRCIKILNKQRNIGQTILAYTQRLLAMRWKADNKYIIPSYLEKIVDMLELIDDKYAGYYYIVIATTYTYFLVDQVLAMKYFIEAMQVGEKYKEHKINGLVLYYLGSIYIDHIQNPLEAIRNLEPLVYNELYDSVVGKTLKCSAIISLVDAYIEVEKIEDARQCLNYLRNYTQDAESLVDENQQIMLKYLEAKISSKEEYGLDLGLKYALEALEKYNNQKVFFKYTHFDFNINLLIGDIYSKLNNNRKSIFYYKECIKYGKKWGKSYEKKAYYSLANIYENIGNHKKALISYKMCESLLIDIIKEHDFVIYQNMQKEFEKLYKEEEIRNLNINNKVIKEQSYKDHLTNLYNRSYLNEVLKVNITPKYSTAFMIDIDCFKKYNDTYGHVKGDFILSRVAKCIQDSCNNKTEKTIRYGGEEFLVISHNKDLEYIKNLADKILSSIYNLKIEHKSSTVDSYITVSIGVSNSIVRNKEDYNKLIKSADEALYEAKKRGRNKIVNLSEEKVITLI